MVVEAGRVDKGWADKGQADTGRAPAASGQAGAPEPKDIEFGLLGKVLGHSYSPLIHQMLKSSPYELVELPDEEAVRAFFARRRFRGVNVTMPYKKVARDCCDELTPVAARLGNVNTVVHRADGTLLGENTDYHGFCRLLHRVAPAGSLAGVTCLVMGDGGASLTVRAALADEGAGEVLVASRTRGLTYDAIHADAGLRARVGLLVNTTPVGMYPHADDPLLLDPADFPGLKGVVDIVYNPLATALVQRARDLGLPAAGGLLMLVSQARASSDAFLGRERTDADEDDVLARLALDLCTVSLIGMPGSGKTTVGHRLACILGKEFVDVDGLVEQKAGLPIPRIFEEQGEEGFRALETACTAEACSKARRIVATGGGVVTRPANLRALRSNGPVVLLTRGLEADDGADLSIDGRPMSQEKGLDRLRQERAPLYHAWAGIESDPGSLGPAQIARDIEAKLRQAAARGEIA